MNSVLSLPPAWQTDPTLKQVLPAHVDWRSFCRLREAPDRYLVCIAGTGIWDIYRNCFSTPSIVRGRKRYFINPGPNAKGLRLWYARIVASLVFPASHNFNNQAHHQRLTLEGDGWQNLRWQTPKQNRDVETERKRAEDDARQKLPYARLVSFIRHVDELKRQHREPNLKDLAKLFRVTPRQLQRILKGQTRAKDVAEIRAKLAAEASKPLPTARQRHALSQYTKTANPFLSGA